MKAKVELTAMNVGNALGEGASSLTQVWKALGGSGSVPGSAATKMRTLVQGIDVVLAANKAAKGGGNGQAKPAKDARPVEPSAKPAGKKAGVKAAGKPVAKSTTKPAAKSAKSVAAQGKWKHDPRNPFRQGSAYALCFDILAAHRDGLPREKLVALLAEATGKDAKHAAYDAQVLLSARPNEDGLNNNDSPCRHRSCRPGFWVKRENGHVQLMID